LKIIIDNLPDLQIIATGSSSFDLSNKINEPLTGRKIVYQLFPFSFEELHINNNFIEQQRAIHKHLIFGSYPQVATATENEYQDILKEITSSYLFKDIFTFQQLRKPELLTKLLRLLAFQIGSQVSYTELAKILQVDQTAVQRYLHLLEEAFVIFRLTSFKQNLRNEIGKSNKFYFWDLGIRNAIIQNFNSIDFRDDSGHLWENFLIAERLKFLANNNISLNYYFWRTYEQKEIDLIEEKSGKLSAYEMKWSNSKKSKHQKMFIEAYPDAVLKNISQDNFIDFLTKA
jgi:predicted AAA+ superfamily ATPase